MEYYLNYPEKKDTALQQSQEQAIKKVKEKFIKKGKKKPFTATEQAEINEMFYSGSKNKIVEPIAPYLTGRKGRGDGGFRL